MIPSRTGTTPATKLLTFEDACVRVGRSARTLRYWVSSGKLQPWVTDRKGRAWFIELHVLRAERSARRANPSRRST